MRVITLMMLISVAVGILRADIKYHYGISGGFGLSDVTHKNFVVPQMTGKVDENVSFHAGGFLQAIAFDLLAVQADVQYIRRGYVIIGSPSMMSQTLTDRFNLHYLEVPVTIRAQIPLSKTVIDIDNFDIQLYYGRSLAYMLAANRIHTGAQADGCHNITEDVNDWDWGQTIGIEILYPKYRFGFKIYSGDNNVYKREDLWACRNASWTAYIGYRFNR